MTNNIKTINDFFSTYYNNLLTITTDYAERYNYSLSSPTDLVSGYYIYVMGKKERIEKLSQIIKRKIKKNKWQHDNEGIIYFSTIIYHITKGNRTFENNCNVTKNVFTNKFEELIIDKSIDEDDFFTENPTISDIIKIAERLAVGDNWYKFEIWKNYHLGKMTYKELAKKYNIYEHVIWNSVKHFNLLMRIELNKIYN